MLIQIERASPEEKASFFKRRQGKISQLLGRSDTTSAIKAIKASPELDDEVVEEPYEAIDDTTFDTVDDVSSDAFVEEVEIVTEAVAEVEEEAPTSAPTADDLTQINGLGPKMAERLNDQGVTTFVQLSQLSDEVLDNLNQAIRGFASTYARKEFKEQAQALANAN